MGFLDDTGLSRLWSKINTKISTAKTEVLQVANDYTDSQISQMAGGIPSYWQNHVDEKVSVIRELMKDAGRNKSSFLWYTDIHWEDNYQKSPAILKYLCDNTPIQKVNFGGGISNGDTGGASSGYTNLFSTTASGFDNQTSKFYTNWLPYNGNDNGGNGTIYHIKGLKDNVTNPYKMNFATSASGANATAQFYCTAANRQAKVTANYDSTVVLVQHQTPEYTYCRFEIRETLPENLIITANEDIIESVGGGMSPDLAYPWRKLIGGLRHHSVLSDDDSNAFGAKGAYGVVMAAEETPDVVRGGDYFYFIDDPNERTRYFYLDTHQCTSLNAVGDAEMMQFIIEALGRLPEGWHAVAISHIWWLRSLSAIPEYCNQLLGVFDGYNLRKVGSVTVDGITLTYDFTRAVGKFEFCIGGNSHTDYSFTTANGIPVILTDTDSQNVVSGSTCTPGTITENAVTAVIANYDERKINIVRVGRGESRVINIT